MPSPPPTPKVKGTGVDLDDVEPFAGKHSEPDVVQGDLMRKSIIRL